MFCLQCAVSYHSHTHDVGRHTEIEHVKTGWILTTFISNTTMPDERCNPLFSAVLSVLYDFIPTRKSDTEKIQSRDC